MLYDLAPPQGWEATQGGGRRGARLIADIAEIAQSSRVIGNPETSTADPQ